MEKCKGEMLIDIMKYKQGSIVYCGEVAVEYQSGMDDKGVIRHCGFWIDIHGQRIPSNGYSIMERLKFFDKNGNEIDEPRITLG